MAALLFLSKHRKTPSFFMDVLIICVSLGHFYFPLKYLYKYLKKKRIIPSYKISKRLGLMMQRAWLNKIPYVVLVE
jgi:hypothetical protein